MKITWYGHSCFRLGARSAALTCELIPPCHYGAFPGTLDSAADKFAAEMKGHNVVAPQPGRAISV